MVGRTGVMLCVRCVTKEKSGNFYLPPHFRVRASSSIKMEMKKALSKATGFGICWELFSFLLFSRLSLLWICLFQLFRQ